MHYFVALRQLIWEEGLNNGQYLSPPKAFFTLVIMKERSLKAERKAKVWD